MGVLRLRTFHASQKVEITHRKKSNKKLKRSRIAKSQKKKKIHSSQGFNFVFTQGAKIRNP